jgi:succinate dehydrogenase / fumarate reductase, cytochrome b subunit
MNLVGSFFGSSIGRKILMAISGLILIGFVIGHLVGNLQIFQDPDHINGYAHFLRQLGPTLWLARLVIIAAVLVHVWAATVLTLENQRARAGGPEIKHTIQATLSSRTMRMTGYVVLAFLFYHLAHFTWGWAQHATFKETLQAQHGPYIMHDDYHVAGFVTVKQGTPVEDVHSMVILGFQNPIVSLFYIVAVGLLSFHLLHGADSMFQTLGLRSSRWARGLRGVVVAFCVLYFLGNLAIPGAVLLGKLQPQNATVARAASPAANH